MRLSVTFCLGQVGLVSAFEGKIDQEASPAAGGFGEAEQNLLRKFSPTKSEPPAAGLTLRTYFNLEKTAKI